MEKDDEDVFADATEEPPPPSEPGEDLREVDDMEVDSAREKKRSAEPKLVPAKRMKQNC